MIEPPDGLHGWQGEDRVVTVEKRGLTPGEVALVRSVFGDALDPRPVRLVRGKFWPLQLPRSAMAPMGSIYFHPNGGGWSDDFSREPVWRQGFFIHEMTHVWQTQKGGRYFLPMMRHPFCRYAYRLVPGRPFERYGIEQQAEIVRRAFLAGPTPSEERDLLPFRPTS